MKNLEVKDFEVYGIESLLTSKDVKWNGAVFAKNSKVIYVRNNEVMPLRRYTDICKDIMTRFDNKHQYITVNISVEDLYTLVSHDIIRLNTKSRTTDTIQRNNIHTTKFASNVVLSLINGNDIIPGIYANIAQEDNGDFRIDINDGMQRLTSICDILFNGSRFNNTETILDGHQYKDIPSSIRDIIAQSCIEFKFFHPYYNNPIIRKGMFKTLNLSRNAMSIGEQVSTTYSGTPMMIAATTAMNKKTISDIFMKSDFSKKKTNDVRKAAITELLFTVACDYLETNASDAFKKANRKKDIIKLFYDVTCANGVDFVTNNPFDRAEKICETIANNMGVDFCHKATSIVTSCQSDYMPTSYKMCARTSSVSSTNVSTTYCVVGKLMDYENTNGVSVDRDTFNAINACIDTVICDKSFKNNYGTGVSGKVVSSRIAYVINNESANSVNNVLENRFAKTID